MRRVRIYFSGRVQGVGFRATARATAAAHPITGWVRNEPDGGVLLEAQGEPHAIDAFLTDLRRRMGRNIASESTTYIPLLGEETSFDIQY